ncbi:TetR/AcrR family transcriptional regulator [Salinibacterium sp. ZJ77]|uniref:TetR/AcrR family transcriptional regulator n=1 Tax=Salinibacterium sp. ZJ77 TaxID=2708337 RepID=UPI00141DD7A0|nr:TetR/AcrR family transcriptional regulator [Salinibacterium sp. ZJ77]
MQTTATDLRTAALEQFAAAGYLGTSIQDVADRAGVSKASVLYHYSSKEALLEAVLAPALDELRTFVPRTAALSGDTAERVAYLSDFVDFLMRNRLSAQIFVTQSGVLGDLPIVQQAQEIMERIADERSHRSLDDHVRFAIALGGAAYLLAQLGQLHRTGAPDDADLRASLIRILGELLAPAA